MTCEEYREWMKEPTLPTKSEAVAAARHNLECEACKKFTLDNLEASWSDPTRDAEHDKKIAEAAVLFTLSTMLSNDPELR